MNTDLPAYTSTITLDNGDRAREAFVSVGLEALPTTRRSLIHMN